jgi:hypothetical protein
MSRLDIDFDKYLKRVPAHSVPLPQEAEVPRYHYERSANDAFNLLVYIERNLKEANVYRASYERHMRRLSTMVSSRLLWPTKGDVWYVKLFLDETVELVNREVGLRLAALLTTLHLSDPGLFEADAKAQELADLFRVACTVDGHRRDPV